jgi:DtxR family Mn-dependent transcriptional regulator
MLSPTEENYLKAIFKVNEREKSSVSTNALAKQLNTTAASVSDMLKKLAAKSMISYEKYYGVTLTQEGNRIATALIRRHRLWEVFLVDKLRFSWHQIHDIAEELEHINSDELILRLDAYLNYPKYDPHGDPIPNADGKFTLRSQTPLSELSINQSGILVGVKEHSTAFLQYLDEHRIKLGTKIKIVACYDFDRAMKIEIDEDNLATFSESVCNSLFIRKT